MPENLYIIGTMNTADRSIGHIDYAVRRRFAFVPVLPDASRLDNGKARELFNKVEELIKGDALSPDFHADDVQPGHTYFMGDTTKVAMNFAYQVYPLLREYYKDGVLVKKGDALAINLNGATSITIDPPMPCDEIKRMVEAFLGSNTPDQHTESSSEDEANDRP